MSKLASVLLVSVVALGLTACESNPPKQAQAAYDARCKFKKTEVLAPEWVCTGRIEGMAVSAIGSYPESAAGEQFMMDQAVLAGRKALVEEAKVYVAALVKSHLETTGVGASETVDAAASSTKKSVTEGTLIGSRMVTRVYGPDGTLWVLVGLNPEAATKMAETTIKSSMGNDKALWQKFLAQKGQDDLAAELAKPKN